MICRKCKTDMVLGIATAQTYVGGMPDFEGETHSSTFSAGGPGEVIKCWKCPDCGHSVEKGEDDDTRNHVAGWPVADREGVGPMIINGADLLYRGPIKSMITEKRREHGVSYGLSEAGYDIRIKQDVQFRSNNDPQIGHQVYVDGLNINRGRFALASAIEEFHMPNNLVGIVHDKSTWARRGLSVFNTVIEPGWEGFLTLELVYHGNGYLHIPAGAGIAQVIFHQTSSLASYGGKYQNQPDQPVGAITEYAE